MHFTKFTTHINKKTPTEAGVQDINPSAYKPYCDKINLEFLSTTNLSIKNK